MEANAHPDLVHIGRLLRDRMDRTLEADMQAARSAARRTRTMRDLLLTAEDRSGKLFATTTDGALHSGVVLAVGSDHIELSGSNAPRIVALSQIVSFEVRG